MSSLDFQHHIRLLCHLAGVGHDHHALPERMGALVCFSLFTGCTDQKDGHDQDTNVGNSVEFDDTDIDIDSERAFFDSSSFNLSRRNTHIATTS